MRNLPTCKPISATWWSVCSRILLYWQRRGNCCRRTRSQLPFTFRFTTYMISSDCTLPFFWSNGWNLLLQTRSIKWIMIRWIKGHKQHSLTENVWSCASQLLIKSRWWYQHEYFIPFCFCLDPWAVFSKLGQGSLPTVFWDSTGPSSTPDCAHRLSVLNPPGNWDKLLPPARFLIVFHCVLVFDYEQLLSITVSCI